jgi:hypothetical protein
MSRLQPILSDTEDALVSTMASITRSKRSDVVRNALAVYHWYIRQAVTGAQIVARKRSGEEVTLETPELAALEAEAHKLSPEELGFLAKQLSSATNPDEAVRLRERLARGFYGV